MAGAYSRVFTRLFCFAISLSFSSLRLLAKCKAWQTQEDINVVIFAKPVQLKELIRTIGSELAEDRNYNEQVEFDSAHQVAMGEDTAVVPAMEPPAFGEGTAGNATGSAFSVDATPAVDFAFPQRESDAESEQDRLDR